MKAPRGQGESQNAERNPAPPTAAKSTLRDRLWDFFSCPNLAPPPEGTPPASRPDPGQTPQRRASPTPGRNPAASSGTKATFGGGVKIGIRSQHNFWAASIRISDLGLLSDFGFRIADYSVHITSDLVNSPLAVKGISS